MEKLEFDFYSLIVDKLKENIGYTVYMVDREEAHCEVFHFPTKEEFNKYFKIVRNEPYRCNMVLPINSDGWANINGNDEYIDGELYLLIDGKSINN